MLSSELLEHERQREREREREREGEREKKRERERDNLHHIPSHVPRTLDREAAGEDGWETAYAVEKQHARTNLAPEFVRENE